MARITVVDSYPDFLELMTTVLDETEGHEVTGMDSSEATLDEVARTRPDLVIADLRTADDALELDGSLGSDPYQVPMIICSGDLPALQARAWLGTLPLVYALEKPFTVEMLTDVVGRALLAGQSESANPPSAGSAV